FNALVAPLVFQSVVEYQIAIVCACLLLPTLGEENNVWLSRRFFPQWPTAVGIAVDVALAGILGVVTFGLIQFFTSNSIEMAPFAWAQKKAFEGIEWLSDKGNVSYRQVKAIFMYGLPILLCYSYVARPLRFGLAVGAFLLASAECEKRTESEVL